LPIFDQLLDYLNELFSVLAGSQSVEELIRYAPAQPRVTGLRPVIHMSGATTTRWERDDGSVGIGARLISSAVPAAPPMTMT
jgi:hypothetical protein